MNRTFSELVALEKEGNLKKPVITETRNKGLPALFRSLFLAFRGCTTPQDFREIYADEVRLFAQLFGSDSPIVEAIRAGAEHEGFDTQIEELLTNNFLTSEHPAAVIPVMYLDEQNVESYLSLLNSIAVLGVKDPISINDEGLILNGQNRLHCAVMLCKLPIPFNVEATWDVEDKMATLAGRNMTPSQKIVAAHNLTYRARYKDSRDAASAIGVSKSLVDGFDKARNTISQHSELNGRHMLDEIVHGRWTVANYTRAANAASRAEKARKILTDQDIDFVRNTEVDFLEADNSMNYFEGLADVLAELSDEVIETLKGNDFPKSMLPASAKDEDAKPKEEAITFLEDGEAQAVMATVGEASVLIWHDNAEVAGEVANSILDVLEGATLVEDTGATIIRIWRAG